MWQNLNKTQIRLMRRKRRDNDKLNLAVQD